MATVAPPSTALRTGFVPVQPARTRDWVPIWRGFFGERLRNSVYGWPEPAFDLWHYTRKVMGFTIHIVTHPEAIERVLLANKAAYLRPRLAQRLLSPLIGNGLLSSEGEDWKAQRRIVAPTFAPGAVARMAAPIAAVARRQVAGWLDGPVRIDMHREATQATMQVIADTLFSSDDRLTTREAGQHIDNLVAAGGQARITTMMGLQDWDISPTMRKAKASREYLRSTLTRLVDERGPEGGADDFFGGLIRALHAQFPPEDAQALAVDNAITFYVAGHETTSNALAWTLYCLAGQPELQEQARTEALIALQGDVESIADRMVLTRQILEEAMRLYPPAPRFDREAQGDDWLGDLRVRRGDLVSIWPWVIHRHRKLWNDPDRFDHDRFAPEAKAAQHRFQYIPFGGGPRVCVGARFATVEALVILAHWLRARRFSLPPGFAPDPLGSVTLRPRGGMWLLADKI